MRAAYVMARDVRPIVYFTSVEPARRATPDWDPGNAFLVIKSVWGSKEGIMQRKY